VFSPDINTVQTAEWRFGISLVATAQMDSYALESELHAVERAVKGLGLGEPQDFLSVSRGGGDR
jgi:hypothetical protein